LDLIAIAALTKLDSFENIPLL